MNQGHSTKTLFLLWASLFQTDGLTPQNNFPPGIRARGGGIFDNKDEWEYYQYDVGDEEADDVSNEEYEYYGERDHDEMQDLDVDFGNDQSDVEEEAGWEEQEGVDDVYAQEQAPAGEDVGAEEDTEFLLNTPISIPVKDEQSLWFGRVNTSNANGRESQKQEGEEDGFVSSTVSNSSPSKSWFSRSKSTTESQSTSQTQGQKADSMAKAKPTDVKQSRWTKKSKPLQRTKRQKSIPSRSTTGTTFIYPTVNKLSTMVRDVSFPSPNALSGERSVIATCFISISKLTRVIFQPMLQLIQSMFHSTASFTTKWISIIMALIRQSADFLWYGPVDGVTTTGISRAGGLGAFTPLLLVLASSVLVVGIVVSIQQQTIEGRESNNAFANIFQRFRRKELADPSQNDEEDEGYDSDDSEPSPEEELQFLNSFDAANPTSRERISKKISKKRGIWPFNTQSRPPPRQEKRQHQRSIKSIQKWWRQRPLSPVRIIEPSHVQNQQPPLSQQIARLKNQLAQSEQERAVLQSDVHRLQHRLQKAHHDAKEIISKNQWLEKQQA